MTFSVERRASMAGGSSLWADSTEKFVSSLDSLKEIADQIIRSFRVINMESLGTVLLPDEYAELRTVFDDRNISSATKVEQLINAGLIETIL